MVILASIKHKSRPKRCFLWQVINQQFICKFPEKTSNFLKKTTEKNKTTGIFEQAKKIKKEKPKTVSGILKKYFE